MPGPSRGGVGRVVGLVRLIVCLAVLGQLKPGYAQPGAFRIGQPVEAYGAAVAVNLRSTPGLAGRVQAAVPNGTPLVIVRGPELADGYVWWEVDGAAGWGWAVEGLLRPTRDAVASREAAQGQPCAVTGPAYPGLYHCFRPGNVHVVIIDLNDPHVRFETVMAYEAAHVHSPQQEWVSDMVTRYPGTVAAINGDYFGINDHGPEGLTIKNGQRLDELEALDRSALVIGQTPLDRGVSTLPIPVQILRLADLRGPLDERVYYNTVGGGPQVVFDSAWHWSRSAWHPGYRACRPNLVPGDIINGECFPVIGEWTDPDKPWTVAGLTPDHKMIWIVGPYQHIASTLSAFAVQSAIKLDGGGSSQLWYHRPLVPGSRPVANALLVFYLRSASVAAQTQWPVVVEGESMTVRLVLENTGAETWSAEEYALVNQANAWGGPTRLPLPHDVRPGEAVSLAWSTATMAGSGIHHSQWRLAHGRELFPGEPVMISTVVLPRTLAAEQDRLQTQLYRWLRDDPAQVEHQVLQYVRQRYPAWYAEMQASDDRLPERQGYRHSP